MGNWISLRLNDLFVTWNEVLSEGEFLFVVKEFMSAPLWTLPAHRAFDLHRL